MLQRFIDWLALTRMEQRVILFLTATLLVGAAVRLYQEKFPPQQQFDYRSADSSFAAFHDQLPSDTPRQKTGKRGNQLNINNASKDELMTLPGIGQVLADRIILFREEEGEFTTTEDLQKVKGISKKKLEKLKPYVTVQ